jgi:DNA-binding transcriptional ArsR family regulator
MDARTALTPDNALAALAGAIAEPSRARMLCALLDGRAHTATELATASGISPPTASAHLSRLVGQALVRCIPQGRHRYFSLAENGTGELLETLLGAAHQPSPGIPCSTPDELRHARTCYDHAAGGLAVRMHDRLLGLAWLVPGVDGYLLSDHGAAAFARIGLNSDVLQAHARGRKHFARPCLDWSERRAHLGGALGSALLKRMLEQRWVQRHLDSRALSVSPKGRRALLDWLGEPLGPL